VRVIVSIEADHTVVGHLEVCRSTVGVDYAKIGLYAAWAPHVGQQALEIVDGCTAL
jgi:uncharacterized protein (UPF0264 family)